MATGLLALLDDVAAIAKLAATSLDDVAAQTAKAGTKAAGVVIDDVAAQVDESGRLAVPRRRLAAQPIHSAPAPLMPVRGPLESRRRSLQIFDSLTEVRFSRPENITKAPMSEVAGRIAVFSAGETLLKHNGGMGLLLSGVPGVPPARVAVLGGEIGRAHV